MTSYGGANLFEYMKHMTIKEALNLGLINKEAYAIIRSEKFWRFFLDRDYPYFILDKDENPESAYRMIYSNKDVKYVDMELGETFEQIKYYQNIHTLNCPVNELTSLIGCPENIKVLNCNNNGLTSLVGCPPNLEQLYCRNNRLISLVGFPLNLEQLYCDGNQLTSLVGCPGSVKILNCSDNRLKSLVGCPSSVKELYCSNNKLQTLDIYLPQINIIIYYHNPLVSPWNEYTEEEIMDMMRTPRE